MVLMYAVVHLGPLLVRLVIVEQAVPVVLGVGQQLLAQRIRLLRTTVQNLLRRSMRASQTEVYTGYWVD